MGTRRFTLAVVAGSLFPALAGPLQAATYYVSPHGSHTAPFSSWATAATNIQDAVSLLQSWKEPPETVLVTNGHYRLTAPIIIAAAYTRLRSVNGPLVTIIDGGDVYRCVQAGNYQTVSGFTLARGRHAQYGGGFLGTGNYCVLDRCLLTSNAAPQGAGAWLVDNATLRNSIVSGNTGGGVFCHWSGNVDNCLVLGNTTTTTSGGAVYVNFSGNIRNTISYFNTGTAARPNWQLGGTAAAASFQSCNLTPDVGSATCFTDEPEFRDADAGDYRLYPGSRCIDAGMSLAWHAGALDLDGNPRVRSTIDVGPYELNPGPLLGSFTAAPTEGSEPLSVTLTSAVSAADTNGLYYRWDLNGDGATDVEGADVAVITHAFGGGNWTVTLTVSNAAGEVSSRTRADCVRVSPSTLYVVPSGSTPTHPFASWATAATNIQDAVHAAAAGTRVLVSNGTYHVLQPVSITKAVTVQAVTPGGVTIDGGNVGRCLYVEHPQAVVEGIRLHNGRALEGAGAYVKFGGTLRGCTVTGNHSLTNGGGIFLYNGGLITGCTVVSNSVGSSGYGWGGGIFSSGSGSMVTNCLIGWNTSASAGGGYAGSGGTLLLSSILVSNTALHAGGGAHCTVNGSRHEIRDCVIVDNSVAYWGGGLHCAYGASATILRNCLIARNSAGQQGGGMWTHSPRLDMANCTVYGNAAPNAGGVALSWDVQSIRNSIIFGNTGSPANWYTTGQDTQTFDYTCTDPLPSYGSHNITADPALVSPASGRYDLRSHSPAVNAGANEAWMEGATDLAGAPRIVQSRVDLGAYECLTPRGTMLIYR